MPLQGGISSFQRVTIMVTDACTLLPVEGITLQQAASKGWYLFFSKGGISSFQKVVSLFFKIFDFNFLLEAQFSMHSKKYKKGIVTALHTCLSGCIPLAAIGISSLVPCW